MREVEASLQRKSWWAALFILPIARRISLLLLNYTNIKPNTITFLSFIFVICSAYCYSNGSYFYLILGALFFEINYLFDCVDGTIARLKKLQSYFGEFLDWKLDRIRIVIITAALGYGQYKVQNNFLPLILSLLYLGLNNLILMSRSFHFRILANIGSRATNKQGVVLVRKTSDNVILKKWLNFTYDRNFNPYYHDVETDAIVFVIGAILNRINCCLITSSILAALLVVILDLLFFKSLNKLSKDG